MLRDELVKLTDVPVVVMDCGTSQSRIGFSTGTHPHTVTPTIVGLPRHVVPHAVTKKSHWVGDDAYGLRGTLRIKYPVEHGVITNWEDIEHVFRYLMFDRLQVQAQQHPFMVVEELLQPRANREKLIQMMFEEFEVPALCLMSAPVLSLHASGRSTGMVVEAGDGSCLPTPVFQGYALSRHIMKTLLSGRDLTYHLLSLLSKGNVIPPDLYHMYAREAAKQIKESLCYVATDYDQEVDTFSCQQERQFELPDGQEITVGKERFQCPEAIFQPTLQGYEMPGLHEIVFNSIRRCDKDIQPELFSNILLCGGSSLFPGFGSRLEKEICNLTGAKTKVQVISCANVHSAFQGAAMIASRSDFLQRSLSKEFYDEYGPSVVARIFFQ